MLLQHGAVASIEDKRGHTPYYWASENGHQSIAQLLPKQQFDWLETMTKLHEKKPICIHSSNEMIYRIATMRLYWRLY
jgi:hypothetical protein